MREQFFAFVSAPSAETFLALRAAQLAEDDFDPYSDELDGFNQLMNEGRHQEALDMVQNAISPNHLLSPGAHFRLGWAAKALGDEKHSELERTLAGMLFEGLTSTGDGTAERPFLVTRTSDEYDYLLMNDLTFASQALTVRDDRRYDLITTQEGRQIWFDVTDIFAVLGRRTMPGGPPLA